MDSITQTSIAGFDPATWVLNTLLTLIVTGSLVYWQIWRAKKALQEQALAEQRYAIYNELQNLSLHYFHLMKSAEFSVASSNVDYVGVRIKVQNLLCRPTIMADEEVEAIYRVVCPIEPSNNPRTMHGLISNVEADLQAKLRPKLVSIMQKIAKENLDRAMAEPPAVLNFGIKGATAVSSPSTDSTPETSSTA